MTDWKAVVLRRVAVDLVSVSVMMSSGGRSAKRSRHARHSDNKGITLRICFSESRPADEMHIRQ
jgi:hypothetical protein